ncbi:hypothetical protein Hanom_Chr10g00947091 [Helianthus anomalus]
MLCYVYKEIIRDLRALFLILLSILYIDGKNILRILPKPRILILYTPTRLRYGIFTRTIVLHMALHKLVSSNSGH